MFTGSVSARPTSSSAVDAPISDEFDDVDPALVATVDMAFGLLMSIGAEQGDRVQAALVTIDKMLSNLQKNKDQVKFRLSYSLLRFVVFVVSL